MGLASPVFNPLLHLARRPALIGGAAGGIAAGASAHVLAAGVPAVLVGWSAGAAIYLVWVLVIAAHADAAHIRARAALLDEGAAAILLLIVGATVASMAAIVTELAHAKAAPHSGATVALAAVTVALSWLFLHTVFAFHYAHAYYGEDAAADRPLDFPGKTEPLYWDFIYFSFICGMTTQVADVVTRTMAMRRLVLDHCIIAFFFNTTIIALGVNIAAGLLG